MKNTVSVWFSPMGITVDGETIMFTSNVTVDLIAEKLPDDLNPTEISGLDWNVKSENQVSLLIKNGTSRKFDSDKYDDYIKPYVDIWQAEKDRLEQEQEEAEAEWNKFENRKARALTQLNVDFETVKDRAHLKSSLGFEADANSTAKENVQGLIEEVGDGTVQFCDYYNQFHELNKSQFETLKSEINQNGQALYAQKWQYRTAIEQCSDNEGLDQVVAGIEFTYMDFTPPAEEPTGDGEQAAETDQSAEQTE